jgi:RNA-binding protein YlmH
MEKDEEKLLGKRFIELAEASETQNRYTYTDFLGLAEIDIFHRTLHEIAHIPYVLFGGHELCERRMARFGNADELGYEEAFPISCLKLSASAPKFAESLTHRDYLGALINLGIERKVLGDIFVSEKCAYLFCEASIADFICDGLTRVKHTAVTVSSADQIPEDAAPHLVPRSVQIPSERIDALISAVLRLSRSSGQDLLKSGRVFVDGRLCESSSKVLSPGSVISVRGHGRFIYDGLERTTKKGRMAVKIREYK